MPISNHVITDAGRARTNAGTSFTSGVFAAALAGNSSHMLLWNPAASGKNLFIRKIRFGTSGAASTMRICSTTNAAMGAIYAPGRNKLIGGAAAAAEVRGGALAMPADPELVKDVIAAGAIRDFIFEDPIKVPPGFGIYGIMDTVNNSVMGSFEWDEV